MEKIKNLKLNSPDDIIKLKNHILETLEFRPYNQETKENAHNLQWKRSGNEILEDGFVYNGKACSDIALVFLALAKEIGIEGYLVKVKEINGDKTHTIVEIKLKDNWYRIDPSSPDALPFEGQVPDDKIYNEKYKLWKRGRDLKEIGLYGIEDEKKIKIK